MVLQLRQNFQPLILLSLVDRQDFGLYNHNNWEHLENKARPLTVGPEAQR